MTKGIEAGADTKAPSQPALSPEALLKAAVTGAREPAKAAEPAEPAARKFAVALDARLAGFAGAALGLMLGAGAMAVTGSHGDRSAAAFAEVNAGLEANRVEATRLNTEIERLGKTLAGLREASEGRRNEARAGTSGVTERLAKLEQNLTGKVTGLGERLEQAEREQAARVAALTTQIEKRAAVAAAAPAPAPQAAASAAPTPPVKAEPTQTGSINDAKAKPAPVENWAVRDVYDGMAVLEDRRRRLVEVGPGDSVPGVGRVEAVERRGRQWVVVTRQGVITPQSW